MKIRVLLCTLVISPLVAVSAHTAAALAQSSKPTPRTADGRPNLNGVWGGGS